MKEVWKQRGGWTGVLEGRTITTLRYLLFSGLDCRSE